MAVDDTWKLVVERLAHYSTYGETLIDTLDRLLKERELKIYDLNTIQNATEEARGLRILIAAAIMSAPGEVLRVSRIAQHALAGPGARHSLVLTEHHDPATGDVLYKVHDKRNRRHDGDARTEGEGSRSGGRGTS